ncbi:MAG: hypothetical protein IAG13_07555 [Deltaproteobacteria bacterium]|nr:hypothetical protein [Nannocystaceae bacterium]
MRIAGWTLVGIGVAAVIGGSVLVAIHEQPIESDCEGSHVDRFGNCEYRWNTVAGGATLLVGGLAAAGTGTALVVVGNTPSPRRAAWWTHPREHHRPLLTAESSFARSSASTMPRVTVLARLSCMQSVGENRSPRQ